MSALEEIYGDVEVTDAAAEKPLEKEPAPESVIEQPKQVPEAASVVDPVQQRADHVAPIAALIDERLKRQELERKIAEYDRREQERQRAMEESTSEAPDPLDDPKAFVAWQNAQLKRVREELAADYRQQNFQTRMQLSREVIEDQIGEDKAKALYAWIDTWGPNSPNHDLASQSGHPYRWAWQKFQEHEKARRGQDVLSKLGDKSLDDYIAEQVSARMTEAQVQAQHTAQVTPLRNPDGKFAPQPSSQQRHTPASLAAVNGSAVDASGEPPRALDALYGDR